MEPSLYEDIMATPAWSVREHLTELPRSDEVRLHYRRARELCRRVDMSVEDIVQLTPKFWRFHRDYIGTYDTSVHTILTIHWNLCIGTIASLGRGRADLKPLLAKLQDFSVCGEFMLTEIGHGLDARNLETTATRLDDGSFELNTPHFSAAKIMPPTTLQAGIARVAVVFAQLMVDGECRGVRPFIVRINEVDRMCEGITSKALPKRAGAKAVDHAVTFFDHVHIPSSALVGSVGKPADSRTDFLQQIWRVSIGSLALSLVQPLHLALSGYIVGKYSQLRRVTSTTQPGSTVPIISFRTQQLPVLSALAMASVFSQFTNVAVEQFMQPRQDPRVKHGIACAYKALVVQTAQSSMTELIDRLGWQGLFGYNTLTEQMLAIRGNAIAEGDILVLCIRLASELIIKRYSLPQAKRPEGLLARHELGLLETARAKLQQFKGKHRSDEFNAQILPRCRGIVQAIGQRMAYEAAADSGVVRPAYLALFETHCILSDMAWYVEHAGISSDDVLERQAQLVTELEPQFETLLEETNAAPYAVAPILSEGSFKDFVKGLPTYTDSGERGVSYQEFVRASL